MTAANQNRQPDRLSQLEDLAVSCLRSALEAYEKGDTEGAMRVAACAGRAGREYSQRVQGIYSPDAEAIVHYVRRLQGDTAEAAVRHRVAGNQRHPGAAE